MGESEYCARVRAMPKADLHVHLSGAIPIDTVKELVVASQITLPDNFNLNTDLQITSPVPSLLEYFRPWGVLKKLPTCRSNLNRIINDTVRNFAPQNIKYAELRHTVTPICANAAVDLQEALLWFSAGLDAASKQHAVDVRLIVTLSRYEFSVDAARTMLRAIHSTNEAGLIVGIDLAGDESLPLPDGAASVFREAKDSLGLGVTIHAGEVPSPENVRWAVEDCQADRVAHVVAVTSDERTLELLATHKVCVEVCLTSNLLIGQVKSLEQHPVPILDCAGIPWVLCSDNPVINNSSLTEEYLLYSSVFPESPALEGMYNMQLKHSFGER